MNKASSMDNAVTNVRDDNSAERTQPKDAPYTKTGEEAKEPIMSRPLAITMLVLFIMCFVVHFVCTGIRGESNAPDSNSTSTMVETD